MFDAKEQAKYYIDKIRSVGRSTNQTLLIVFIPLFFLYLIEIEPRYPALEDLIAQKHQILYLKNKSKDSNRSLDSIYYMKDSINKTLVSKYPDSNERLKNAELVEIKIYNTKDGYNRQAKKKIGKIESLKKKEYETFDTLTSTLAKLKIPVTLPILNVKLDSFSFKFIVVLIMFFYTTLLWNCYLNKKVIINTLYKFLEIVKIRFSSSDEFLYSDYDFNFPFWFFPIRKKKILDKDQRTLLKVIGIPKRKILFSNILIYVILFIFILINCRLLFINWNLNYKVFHSGYSILNTFSFSFFLLDIILLYLLLRPIIPYKISSPHEVLNKYNVQRRDLIKLAIVVGFCALIEPVYNYFDKGNKWFQNPRYLQKKTPPVIVFKKGLYLHEKRGKIRNIHYFNKFGKNSCIKTIAKKDLLRFKNNLQPILFLELMNNKKNLVLIEEDDLIQFVSENKEGYIHNLNFLTKYINSFRKEVSPETINLFTRLYATVKPGKSPDLVAALEKINYSINKMNLSIPGDSSHARKLEKWDSRLKM